MHVTRTRMSCKETKYSQKNQISGKIKRKIENRKTSRHNKSIESTSREISRSIHSKPEPGKLEKKINVFLAFGQNDEASPSEQVQIEIILVIFSPKLIFDKL